MQQIDTAAKNATMQKFEEIESLIYRQKIAHKTWLGKILRLGASPSQEACRLVWELLVAYGEFTDENRQARDDIYKTAYDLAETLLDDLDMSQIYAFYRDALLDSMIENHDTLDVQDYRRMLRFANLISTAFCEANSDALKKAILHDRVESMSNELRLAKRIQQHLLPKVIPTIPGFEFAGRLIPAEEIGGDYWSVKYKETEGIVTLKLADITGHGVAAATLVAAVKFISGGYYQGASSAAEVMQKTNRVLTLETPHEILVTMVYGWLRPAEYEIALVNAGHSPAFICSNNLCYDIPTTGPVLGVKEDATYSEEHYKLRKGDIIFFGSDGITDAGITEPFGVTRLKETLIDNASLSADKIADKVVEAVTSFAKQPHDDISLLVVKVTGEPPERT